MLACWLLLTAFAAPDDELLLIGLRAPDGALSTVLVDGSVPRLAGKGLAVPRRAGWWRLDVLRAQSGEVSLTGPVATPAAKWTGKPPPLEAGEGCEEATQETVLFVGADTVSVEYQGGGYCEGAAHGWALKTLRTRTLDGKAASLDLLGEQAGARHAASGKKALDRQEGACLAEPRPDDWALIRARGAWTLRGALTHGAEVCRGSSQYFTVEGVTPPESFTGAAAPGKAWQPAAGVLDVVESGPLTVLVTKQGLEVLAAGKSAGKLEAPGAAIVMTQTARGEAAGRWRTEVPSVLGKP